MSSSFDLPLLDLPPLLLPLPSAVPRFGGLPVVSCPDGSGPAFCCAAPAAACCAAPAAVATGTGAPAAILAATPRTISTLEPGGGTSSTSGAVGRTRRAEGA